MSKLQTKLPIEDTWVVASWDEYMQAIADPAYKKAKGYYHNGQMRIEMSPVSFSHSRDHAIIIVAVNLFAIFKGTLQTSSQVLPGLAISVLVEALQRSRQQNQSLVGAWLLSQFQQ